VVNTESATSSQMGTLGVFYLGCFTGTNIVSDPCQVQTFRGQITCSYLGKDFPDATLNTQDSVDPSFFKMYSTHYVLY
jgi:hypothetical protein